MESSKENKINQQIAIITVVVIAIVIANLPSTSFITGG